MLTRVIRWFLIAAPAFAGILLLAFGTAGATSQAFGWTLIGIAALVWLSNFFIRMTFDEDKFEREAHEREQRAAAQQLRHTRSDPSASKPSAASDLSAESERREPGAPSESGEPPELPERPRRPLSRHPPAGRLSRRPRRPT